MRRVLNNCHFVIICDTAFSTKAESTAEDVFPIAMTMLLMFAIRLIVAALKSMKLLTVVQSILKSGCKWRCCASVMIGHEVKNKKNENGVKHIT